MKRFKPLLFQNSTLYEFIGCFADLGCSYLTRPALALADIHPELTGKRRQDINTALSLAVPSVNLAVGKNPFCPAPTDLRKAPGT